MEAFELENTHLKKSLKQAKGSITQLACEAAAAEEVNRELEEANARQFKALAEVQSALIDMINEALKKLKNK